MMTTYVCIFGMAFMIMRSCMSTMEGHVRWMAFYEEWLRRDAWNAGF